MSLQGSLETFALPDVLVLLSSTKKDGELRVSGDRVEGRVWLEKGQIVHSAMGDRDAPAVDAVFELLRLRTGDFVFEAGGQAPRRSGSDSIDSVLAAAQARLAEWAEIEAIVPNLDAIVDMADEAPADEVRVSRDQWSLLRSVAGGRSVHELMSNLGRSEFDTCRTVKELVDAGMASVDAAAGARSRRPERPAPAAAAAAAAAGRPSGDEARGPASNRPTRDPSRYANREPSRAAAEGESVHAGPEQLEALAEMASRPRRHRPEPPTGQPAQRTPAAAPEEAEEARALVAQLAALAGDDEEKVAEKVAAHLASGGELPEVPAGDEPINRGLLLKFLSSVRN